ncbi:peptidoglycan-binding domain-containing protein [Phreatobacter stygius]|uniref:Peptidoglycan binding-like domain-containing protein n=1 Tax=Phreatobacter stygius TaxID=1940610 RepID=A0A4D7AW96_9HYPH|nr:peptidoglycan-binding domain-containing protein [Phreatobacter stygius]QCI63253.1 hypothetical protein E8M01_02795 [Phreatobacter stygius]
MLRNVAFGQNGEDVRAVQQGLNLALAGKHPRLDDDGKFGPATDTATRFFQRRSGLNPDGIVGQNTRRKLFPLRVVTVTALGMRLVMPEVRRGIRPPKLGPGPLIFPGLPGSQPPPGVTPNLLANQIQFPANMVSPVISFQTQKFPRLAMPILAPPIQPPKAPQLTLPLPNVLPAPSPGLAFDLHHFELVPGGQATLGQAAQFGFTLALQAVVMGGDEKGPHQEVTSGIQIGTPVPGLAGGEWVVAFFAQVTDVDRLGPVGNFHFWQPYAQVGIQNSPGSFRPQATAGIFPANLTLDVTDRIGINIAGGVVLTYDPASGLVVGGQATGGLILKLGQ